MKASLFVTCLVDQFFPNVGESTVQVLRRLGVDLDCPKGQTCCGQPLFNTGYREEARELAERFIGKFRNSECVVAPSGSCVAMVRHHFPELLADDPALKREAEELAAKTYEFSEFVVKVLGCDDAGGRYQGRVTYHEACHLLRELGISEEPRRLISNVRELELIDLPTSQICCGFGGTFSVKFPEISSAMLGEKIQEIAGSKVDAVVANDVSCLMQIRGALKRQALPIH
jgi:L-lactate dehydrogenase complex protein LldE